MFDFIALKHPMLVHLPVAMALLLPLALIAAQRPGRGIKPWWITCRYLAWMGFLGLFPALLSGWLWARNLGLIAPGKFLAPFLSKATPDQWLQVALWKHQMAALTSLALAIITLTAMHRKRQDHQGLGIPALFFGLLWTGALLTTGFYGGKIAYPAPDAAAVVDHPTTSTGTPPTQIDDPEADAPLRALNFESLEPFQSEPVKSTAHGNRWVRVWVTPSGMDAYREGKALPAGAYAVMNSFEDRWGRPSFETGPLYMLETLANGKPSLTYYWPHVPEAKRGETLGQARVYWRGKDPDLAACMSCHTSGQAGQAPVDQRSTWKIPRRTKPESEAATAAPTQ